VQLRILRGLHRRLLPHILPVKLAQVEEPYARIRCSYLLDLFDILWQVNDYFLINDSYYDAVHARRQYDWEECLHDWLNAQFMRIKTSFKGMKSLTLRALAGIISEANTIRSLFQQQGK
jgi:uncharacterized protein (UPF0262 family)